MPIGALAVNSASPLLRRAGGLIENQGGNHRTEIGVDGEIVLLPVKLPGLSAAERTIVRSGGRNDARYQINRQTAALLAKGSLLDSGSLTRERLCRIVRGTSEAPMTRRTTRRALSLLCVASLSLTAAPNAAWAHGGALVSKRDVAEWTNLSALSPGAEIEVADRKSTKKHRGAFVAFDDAGVSLRDDSGEQSVQRQDVLSVKVRGGRLSHGGIWMIGGAAVGTAAGVLAANSASKVDSSVSWYAANRGRRGDRRDSSDLVDVGISKARPSYRLIYRSR